LLRYGAFFFSGDFGSLEGRDVSVISVLPFFEVVSPTRNILNALEFLEIGEARDFQSLRDFALEIFKPHFRTIGA